MDTLEQIKGGVVVSCQALENEPLHSSFIMGRMALAAKEGGAVGIRANTTEDINEIKRIVDLPVIGIIKRDYDGSEVFITATEKEVEELWRRKQKSLHWMQLLVNVRQKKQLLNLSK